ncbi:phage major capsid protein [Methylobacterium radiotolerans]|nr:phage major capsid protein [Methylobacterium radiotolerans]
MFTRNTSRHFGLAGLAIACLVLLAVPDAHAATLAHHATHLGGLSPVDLVAASFGLTAAHREYGRKDAGGGGADPSLAQIQGEMSRILGEVKGFAEKSKQRIEEQDSRLLDVEQKLARRSGPGGGTPQDESWGNKLTESEGFKGFVSGGLRGTARVEVKALTSATGSGGALVTPARQPGIVALPQRPMTVRGLLAPGETESNLVQFVRQTVRTNNATTVAEGAQKPESVVSYEEAEAAVRTIAHWIPISRQLFDDVPALRSTLDGELVYGLDEAEERQLLLGDGTGQNLLGLLPQATAFDTALLTGIASPTRADTLLMAIGQAEKSLLPATGMVLNTMDWIRMVAMKDTTGQYIGSGPFGPEQLRRVWGLPTAVTPVMPEGRFLVGSFAVAAQIFDRMDAEVLVSSEDRDNFIRNMLTARAEKRLALAVKRSQAMITGSFPAPAQG